MKVRHSSYLVLLLLLVSSPTAFTQQMADFFKAIPADMSQAPAWAVEMYSDNPDVFKVDTQYDAYRKSDSFTKTIHTQNYKHWRKSIAPFLSPEGRIYFPSQKDYNQKLHILQNKRNTQRSSDATWSCIGPFETYKSGTTEPFSQQANVYSLALSTSNDQKLIAGTESGGVYLTIDKGSNWDLISKDAVFGGGVGAVAISPDDENTFFAAANERIYKTTDEGANWTETMFIDGGGYEFTFDPDDATHIFLASSTGLFESEDNGENWDEIIANKTWDIVYHPSESEILYALVSDPGEKRSEFFKSVDGGTSFTQVTSGWYSPENFSQAVENGGKIGVSIDEPDRVYACLIGSSKADDNGWIGIYRSDDKGESWSLPSGQIGGPYESPNTMPWNAAAYSSGYHQGFYNFDFEVSPNDVDLMWFGTIRLCESADGGASYVSIGAANSTRLNDVHADIQAIEVNGTDTWVASDGGINLSSDDLQSHIALNYGITAANFWGFGHGWNEDVYVGGKYHTGNTAFHESYGPGNTHNVGGVEEATGYVNPLDNKTCYFNQYWSGGMITRYIPATLGDALGTGPILPLIPNETYVESSSSGYFFHPNYANIIYAGQNQEVFKSVNGGVSWESIHAFSTDENARVYEIIISPNAPNVLYAVYKESGVSAIWTSSNGGDTWQACADIPSNNLSRIEICQNPQNENEIWVSCNNGANNQKVYRSLDGGNSWENKTTASLDDESIKDITFQGNASDAVYLVTANNAYYYDVSSDDWVNFSSGLPFVVSPLQMQVFHRDHTLRLATSRGIWERELIYDQTDPYIDIVVNTDTVSCSRDTVVFDSHSFLAYDENATFNWDITPAPSFISNPTDRKIKTVLGANGSYDATLEVTIDNQSYSKTIVDLVQVDSKCFIDSLPGNSLLTENSGDYVQLSDLGISTNSFTMTAWVHPDGIQADYSGIVMNDGDAAGMNFRGGNNTLGYHWPGGAWWWDSGLVVPSEEWSYLALVAEPDGITLYLNGVGVKHNTSINEVALSTMKIASYKGWGDRNFYGQIDEVCMWNRALSEEEIRQWRHLTKDKLDLSEAEGYLCNYSFNEESGATVLDGANTFHGNLSGNASRILSTASLGGGFVNEHLIDGPGTFDYPDAGVQLSFSSGTNFPDGDVYASFVRVQPHEMEENHEGLSGYWILNNYGDNNLDHLSQMQLDDPFGAPSYTATNYPNLLELWHRDAMGTPSMWSLLCNGTSISGEQYDWPSNSCNILFDRQFFISQDCDETASFTVDLENNETLTLARQVQIDANATVKNNASLIMDAGQLIELENNFEVEQGGALEVKIGGCGNQ